MSAGVAGYGEKPPACPAVAWLARLAVTRGGREQAPPMALRGTSCIAGWTITPPGLGTPGTPLFRRFFRGPHAMRVAKPRKYSHVRGPRKAVSVSSFPPPGASRPWHEIAPEE